LSLHAPFTKAITIGITGSNGKTTTTMLTYHLLKSAGLNVGLGGNIGKSFAWQVAEENYDVMFRIKQFSVRWNHKLQATHCNNYQYKSGSFRSIRL
jgi:UDP-N-acetylmuramoylalanine-D-glutamate ligase